MDDYDELFKTICRLCLTQSSSDKMVSLIDNSNEEDGLSCFGKAITIVTNVLLHKNDKLPNMMCYKCAYLLKHAVYFKLKCEASNQRLKQLCNLEVNNELSDRDLKEKVCEYVMYNQYFPVESSPQPTTSDNTNKNGLKSNSFLQKNDNETPVEKVETNAQSDDNIYDFNDFIDHDDTIENNDKPEEYSDEIDNVLDTIQDIINTESSTNTFKRRKIKRQRQKYRPNIRSNERNLICKICHKILANRLTYDHHMQRHNHCRYICDQCGKGFPVLTEMHMHQIARHGIGPYLQCDHCPYKAPRKLNLIEHLRIHTGERPFTCEKCGLTFRRRAIWRNHLVCHMEKKHQCTYCPRKFYRHSQMLAHCNNVHERVYMYMCSVCSVTYTKTETVRRHMIVKHGIPREKQGRIVKIRY
ncbi:uncharacterized protein LOC142983098 [Anticarsia gemmatalis]|uniref:uncharacterized protein LOC142983098 n=1 Tax=Anticarsia gemmatalis TaxID=129554 RepID=UPI003F763A25